MQKDPYCPYDPLSYRILKLMPVLYRRWATTRLRHLAPWIQQWQLDSYQTDRLTMLGSKPASKSKKPRWQIVASLAVLSIFSNALTSLYDSSSSSSSSSYIYVYIFGHCRFAHSHTHRIDYLPRLCVMLFHHTWMHWIPT